MCVCVCVCVCVCIYLRALGDRWLARDCEARFASRIMTSRAAAGRRKKHVRNLTKRNGALQLERCINYRGFLTSLHWMHHLCREPNTIFPATRNNSSQLSTWEKETAVWSLKPNNFFALVIMVFVNFWCLSRHFLHRVDVWCLIFFQVILRFLFIGALLAEF